MWEIIRLYVSKCGKLLVSWQEGSSPAVLSWCDRIRKLRSSHDADDDDDGGDEEESASDGEEPNDPHWHDKGDYTIRDRDVALFFVALSFKNESCIIPIY